MLVLILGALIILLDQATKQVVRDTMALHQSIPVVHDFFSLTYLRNTGAAWGILGGQNTWLILLSAVMLVLMIVFRRSFLNDTTAHRVALGCMIGGIVGNLMDRLRLGYVTDFLDFYIRDSHFPAFNVADSAICIGVALYIVTSFLDEWREKRRTRPAESSGTSTAPGDSSPS